VDNGVTSFVEIGPGKVLSGLVKRIAKDSSTCNVEDATGVKSLEGGA
jgi:[acyl-carrier-protein] S-malonyltransferase